MAAYYLLCVEDDSEQREAMVRNLLLEGRRRGDTYVIDAVESPEEAWNRIRRGDRRYDVILTDIDFTPLTRKTGQWLMQEVIQYRETRGYDIAPEIVCITGHARMVTPEINNDIKLRGGVFVVKGEASAYVVEVLSAIQRVQRYRSKGLNFIFQHKVVSGYSMEKTNAVVCAPDELIYKAIIEDKGRRVDLASSRVPLAYLNLLAKYAFRTKGLTREEILHTVRTDEFFRAQFRGGENPTKHAFLNALRRADAALGRALNELQWNMSSSTILVVEYYSKETGQLVGGTGEAPNTSQSSRARSFHVGRGIYARYRLHSNSYIEHIP